MNYNILLIYLKLSLSYAHKAMSVYNQVKYMNNHPKEKKMIFQG